MKRIFSILICLCLYGCAAPPHSKPKILVTIPPYADIVQNIVGDQVEIEVFVPPGSNPHTYEPTPNQIKKLTQTKIWFRIGDPIENKMAELLKQRKVEVVDISKEWAFLSTSDHSHEETHLEERDLHVWLSPKIVVFQVELMTTVLCQQFPEKAVRFKENATALIDRLNQLDAEISSKMAPFYHRYLLVSHPALGYYCERYGLHQVSVEVEGKDPLPQDIAHLMDKLKNHPVPVVFIEPQYNKKGAILIADKLHVPYEEINPYAEDYFGMLNNLTHLIVKYYGHPTT